MELYTPILLAIRLDSEPELEEGETEPLRLICIPIDDFRNEQKYVVKFGSKMTLDTVGVASEIVAGYLAQYFEIPVPEFVLVEITSAFCQSANDNVSTPTRVLTTLNQNQNSHNFGSLNVGTDTTLPLALKTYSREQLQMAENIFAFDALIYNADRTELTPNMFGKDDTFLIYDHEKAFNFLFHTHVKLPKHLDFRTPNGEGFMHNHIFRPVLRKKEEINFDDFIDKLKQLSDDMIANIIEQIPRKIRSGEKYQDDIAAIKEHLIFAREHPQDFRINLMRVLA